MAPVVGLAPLSPVAAVPELHADDVLAVHAAVVVPAAFPNVLCLPALLSCLRNTDLRHLRLTTPVVHRTGSGTAASEVLKASRTKAEVLRARVPETLVVHLASGLTISDQTPGFPKLSLPQEPSKAKARSRAGSRADRFGMPKGVRSRLIVSLDAAPEETLVDPPPGRWTLLPRLAVEFQPEDVDFDVAMGLESPVHPDGPLRVAADVAIGGEQVPALPSLDGTAVVTPVAAVPPLVPVEPASPSPFVQQLAELTRAVRDLQRTIVETSWSCYRSAHK